MLRDYQQAAHDAAITHIRSCLDSCVIEAATGAGKSHIIAALAETLHTMSKGKHILCLAPSAELVIQNREKYLATGNPASMMSASTGEKSLKHPVVFGTPGTVKNRVHRFGSRFCAVIVDECHKITPTIIKIIEALKEVNDKIRVIGLSATPYRLGTGYVYEIDHNNNKADALNPYFKKKVYSVHAKELIKRGFLTEPVIGATDGEHYNTLGIKRQSTLDKACEGQGRKTAAIIADIVGQSQNRAGVMIFAATVQHAYECMESLPQQLSAIVHGKTPDGERADILRRFKAREIKYLVNVTVLTTGFDAPHVDVVALLRATESVSLLQQIIGRGLRIDDHKKDCLILDYAENIERHCPDGDLFNPNIKTTKESEKGEVIKAVCEWCSYENHFSQVPNKEGFGIDKNGYFVDLLGARINTDFGPMPAHFGRRCEAYIKEGTTFERCGYRWTFKECVHCEHENDIAARYCTNCKGEIVDPNEKLRLDFAKFKKDPTQVQTDKVLNWVSRQVVSNNGNECLKVDFTTEYRTFTVWYQLEPKYDRAKRDLALFKSKKDNLETVTYKKNSNGFYSILNFNRPIDEIS